MTGPVAGYVLCDAPELLKNAQGNPAVGLVEALKALVRVQEMMQAADLYILPSFGSSGPVKAYVQLRELALLAKEAGVSTQDFANVEMKVTADDHGEHRIYNVEAGGWAAVDPPDMVHKSVFVEPENWAVHLAVAAHVPWMSISFS
eukprot:s102_g16.t1